MNGFSAIPLVSIIIPTFRRSERLRIALESVCGQNYENFETIVCDDNSDPTESEKVAIVCSEFPRVKYVKNFRKKGGCGARNSGSKVASGEYLAFLDDDDIWLPQKLSTQISHMIQNHWQASFSAAIIESTIFGLSHNLNRGRHIGSPELFSGICPLSTSLLVIEKELFSDAGMFDEELVSFQDFDLYARVSTHTKIYFCPEVLAKFVDHDGDRTSINLKIRFQGLDQITSKWHLQIESAIGVKKFKKKFISFAYVGNAKARLGDNYWQAIVHMLNALRFGERGIYELKWLVIILFGKALAGKIMSYRKFLH